MAETTTLAQQRAAEKAPARSAEAIRQDIAAKRDSISGTVDKLGERIHQTLDWKEYVAEYPMVALGLAAGAGFLIAGLFKRKPSPRERILDALAEITEDFTDQARNAVGSALGKGLISSKPVKAALTAAVTKAALDFGKRKAVEMLVEKYQQSADARDESRDTQYQGSTGQF
jgi:ElaB/YqjD/DUF883 family membrane-anchored ribosome-binding protein